MSPFSTLIAVYTLLLVNKQSVPFLKYGRPLNGKWDESCGTRGRQRFGKGVSWWGGECGCFLTSSRDYNGLGPWGTISGLMKCIDCFCPFFFNYYLLSLQLCTSLTRWEGGIYKYFFLKEKFLANLLSCILTWIDLIRFKYFIF